MKPLIDREFFQKLDNLNKAMSNLLDRNTPKHITEIPGLQEFLMVVVLATQTIFRTITYVSRDDGGRDATPPTLELGLATSPLVRSLMELLFTIVLIKENPQEHIVWFHEAGWRELKELRDGLFERYGTMDSWQSQLSQFQTNLDLLAVAHKISDSKQGAPNLINYWPTPMQMLNPKNTYLSKEGREFLSTLTLLYRSLSQDHHVSGAGIVRIYAKLLIDEKDERRDKVLTSLKNSNVLTAASLLLSVYSEINDLVKFDRNAALAYCWERLSVVAYEARNLYQLRYQSMLANSEGGV